MAPSRARGYLRGMVKDICLLIGGVGFVALSWPLLAHSHIEISSGFRTAGSFMSSGAMALLLGLTLIVVAIADWRYRRRNAQGS